ncbi:phospholipase-like protein [Tanacetum coccineum]|uniref:Phospholipase-like protein n=1 Tax=Tanacetum coccineum TaxID=301880 RepID=A0ABQ4YE48_9ASTR
MEIPNQAHGRLLLRVFIPSAYMKRVLVVHFSHTHLILEDEEKMLLEQEKNIIEEQRFRLEEAKRMTLEEDKVLQIADQQGPVKCKFPWSDDYTVGLNFWLTLACLDPSRKGWLTEEHIDLWVDYMLHGRPDNANRAMVRCYFVQILLQNSTPLFYANDDKYAIPWSDVDQEHLPVILLGAKGIDPTDYYIRFKIADSVPKQGGIFGDCDVWVCIFLYRLAHGLSLDAEDPFDVALAYREKMVHFYFSHKT